MLLSYRLMRWNICSKRISVYWRFSYGIVIMDFEGKEMAPLMYTLQEIKQLLNSFYSLFYTLHLSLPVTALCCNILSLEKYWAVDQFPSFGCLFWHKLSRIRTNSSHQIRIWLMSVLKSDSSFNCGRIFRGNQHASVFLPKNVAKCWKISMFV